MKMEYSFLHSLSHRKPMSMDCILRYGTWLLFGIRQSPEIANDTWASLLNREDKDRKIFEVEGFYLCPTEKTIKR